MFKYKRGIYSFQVNGEVIKREQEVVEVSEGVEVDKVVEVGKVVEVDVDEI